MTPGTTNLALSGEELQLVNNTEWILTKRRVMDKAIALLGNLSQQLQELVKKEAGSLAAEMVVSEPKISKGENYQGLPYAVLDYPRHFVKEDILAIRTLFWWGNFFSVTLHISGVFKQRYQQQLLNNLLEEGDGDIHLFTGTDPWQHHFGEDNYTAVVQLDREQIRNVVETGPFIKLACRYPLDEWEHIPARVLDQSARWLRWLPA